MSDDMEKKAQLADEELEENIKDFSDESVVLLEIEEDIDDMLFIDSELLDNEEELDAEAESLIRWGSARAGVIVITPLLGTVALMANEVYMIGRVAKIYGMKLSDRTIIGFLGAFGAKIVGSMAVTLIPIPGVGLPVAVSVTYGVGKVAQSWIKDGMPVDLKPYIDKFDELKEEGKTKLEEISADSKKNTPLGDEKKVLESEDVFHTKNSARKFAGAAGSALNNLLLMMGVKQETVDDKKALAKGIYEVTKETAEEFASEIKAKAKEKAEMTKTRSGEWKKQASEKTAEIKEEITDKAVGIKEEIVDKAAGFKQRVDQKVAENKESKFEPEVKEVGEIENAAEKEVVETQDSTSKDEI